MTINQCAPGCGLGQPGEGAAALFQKGTLNFCWGDLIAQPGGQCGQYDNQTKGGGVWAKTVGGGVAATLFEAIWDNFLAEGGG